MDRNLGASRVATSLTDSAAYGDLYQWGRLADGHERRTSATIETNSATDVPGHSSFILENGYLYDWRTPQNDNLWQGVSGINNPCPEGFRLPTGGEWEAEIDSWSGVKADGFVSPLKLVLAGFRADGFGGILNDGVFGDYWSSTVNTNGPGARHLTVINGSGYLSANGRAQGCSVRCIKN